MIQSMPGDEVLWYTVLLNRSAGIPNELPSCPRCDSQDTRFSHSANILDFLLRQLLDRVPFRCRHCRLRFYRKTPQQSAVLREAAAVKRWTDGLRKRPR